jgi:hypothetical protein
MLWQQRMVIVMKRAFASLARTTLWGRNDIIWEVDCVSPTFIDLVPNSKVVVT